MAKSSHISISLRGTDRRRLSTPSRAKYFYLYLDGKIVLKGEFSKVSLSVAEKEAQIAYAFLVYLSQRYPAFPKNLKKAKKKAPQKGKKKAKKKKKKAKKKVSKTFKKALKAKKEEIQEELKDEFPEYDKTKVKKPKFHGVVDKVSHTPINTPLVDFKKKIVTKTVYSKDRDVYFDLEILDVEFKEPVKFTQKTREEAKLFIKEIIFPQMIDFYREHPGDKDYMPRITFRREVPVTGEEQESGFGSQRIRAVTERGFILSLNYQLLSDDRFFISYRDGRIKNDYFAGSFRKELEITGFTLEVIVKEEPA